VDTCRDCPSALVSGARSAFAFHGPARSAIHRLKYAGWRGVGEALARAMVAAGPVPPAQVVTWVPLTRRRLAERGYDQARTLAIEVARAVDLPVTACLRRTRTGGSQARRSGAERRAALRGAFSPRVLVPPSVLLVDDVLTTGATATSCAEALVAAGARDVWLLTAARSFSGSAYTQAGPRPGLWLPGDAPR
jgi:ComF family protein